MAIFPGLEELSGQRSIYARVLGSPERRLQQLLLNIGDMRMTLGEIARPEAYQESLETFRKNGEKSKAAYPLVGMGDVYAASGDFADAEEATREVLSISNESARNTNPPWQWQTWGRS